MDSNSYIGEAALALGLHCAAVGAEVPDPELLGLYTLLVLTCGEYATARNVHDAWAVWRAGTRPDHPDLVPWEALSPEAQAKDEPYAAAVRATAAELAAHR